MIILINTKTNERRLLTQRELFEMFADEAIASRMQECDCATVHGKRIDALVYTYSPE